MMVSVKCHISLILKQTPWKSDAPHNRQCVIIVGQTVAVMWSLAPVRVQYMHGFKCGILYCCDFNQVLCIIGTTCVETNSYLKCLL